MWALVLLSSLAITTIPPALNQRGCTLFVEAQIYSRDPSSFSSSPSVSSSASSPAVSSATAAAAAATVTATASSLPAWPSQQQGDLLFRPALIGFRCESSNEVTPDGITIIEANSPVRITLFGESFTTETIVGFTTEYAPKTDAVDEVIAANSKSASAPAEATATVWPPAGGRAAELHDWTATEAGPGALQANESARQRNGTARDEGNRPDNEHSVRRGLRTIRSEVDIAGRRHRRRLLDSSYDCTDYDRVISYKLTEANIITPNVAVLTISLPELETRTGPGMYYYFCIKQPLELSAAGDGHEPGAGPHATTSPSVARALAAASAKRGPRGAQQAANSTPLAGAGVGVGVGVGSSQRPLFWVHQGDEWWLMIKVEPPILSIANDCILIVLLLFLSAVTSGLNLGLMSLDMNELAVISSCGDQRERSYARTIAPLRKRGNYLLCSLLLGNVMVNSTLTVILEEMTSGLVAVIGSTLAIVVLGEIVPQAFCARRGLAIGARTIYLTYAFMLITFPLSYPISCLLDCVLGEEKGNVYDRERLMEFIRITGNHTQLEADEVAIISGALKLKKIKVDQIMTRIEDVFMLPMDCMLDRQTIRRIIEKGYSRIPIYEFNDRKQIVALILAKDLALLDPDDRMPLANMLMYCKHPLVFIEDSATLDVALNEFKTGKSHMAIVRQIYDDGEVDKYYEAIGVVTLEDVIEEVLQTEINDETDTLSDNRRKRRRADAQVAHLVDELIGNCSPTTAAAVGPNLRAIVASAQQHHHHHHHQLEQFQSQAQPPISSPPPPPPQPPNSQQQHLQQNLQQSLKDSGSLSSTKF